MKGVPNLKISKLILIFILPTTILLSVVLASILQEDTIPAWFKNISAISSALIAYFLFLKDHSIKVFILWNKLKGLFKRDTIAWKGTYKFSFYEENYNFIKDVDSLIKRIKLTFEDDVEIKHIDNNNENYASFTIMLKGYNRMIRVYNKPSIDENTYRLSVEYEVSVSYSDSRTEIKRYNEFLNVLSKSHKVIGKESITDNSEKELYAINLSFSKYNPFYGLSIKHIDDKAKSVKFNLKFEVENIKITTTKNTLKAVSENKEQLINVLNDYVALSTIG